jgi:endoglucanase
VAARIAAGLATLLLAVAARATPAPTVSVPNERVVTISVNDVDPARCCTDPSQIRIRRERDGAAVPVLKVGVDRRVTDLPANFSAASSTTRVHALLDSALIPGQRYIVTLQPLGIETRATYEPEARTRAIAVDQLGYVPAARKVALIGDWLGTAGPMPIEAREFEVVDEHGTIALRAPLVLRQAADPWSGDDVWLADFSAITHSGRFHVRVAGLGVSDSFQIRDDVYDPAYRSVMRVLYHHRNSTALDAAHAAPGYTRAGGVADALDAVFDSNVGSSVLGHGEGAGEFHATRRGWFDAGDYGQYVVNAAPVWYAIGLGLDLSAGSFRDGDLSIPESGNGIPDVLDELEWGFDWMLSMQDSRDGGVYSRVASERWDDSLPAAIRRPRLIAEKTTHATASFAAVAAIQARLLGASRPKRAATALAAARAAWRFIGTHPQWPAEGERYRNRPGMHAGEYADASALDNRMWAAAELLRATGEAEFRGYFEAHFRELKLDPTQDPTYADAGMAAVWAYVSSDDPARDGATLGTARKAIIAGADWRIRQMEASAWFAPTHPRRSLVGWGNFAQSARAALNLLQAQRLTGDRRYLEAAWLVPHVELGLNPQGICYLTGLGARSPLHPLSKLSQHSGAGHPLPGLPVNGPHARLPGTWPTTRLVNSSYWPAPVDDDNGPQGGGFPVARRYVDSDQLPPMSEPTIAEIARVGVAFGLLRDGRVLSGTAQQ